MIETVISLPLTEWVIIFSLLIGLIIYSNWSISKYKEAVEEKIIWMEIAQLRRCQLTIEKRGRDFMIYDFGSNIIHENLDDFGL